jgi:putative DNA primase/helicase
VPASTALDYKFQDNVQSQFQAMTSFPFAPADGVIRVNLKNGTLEFQHGQAPRLVGFDKRHGLTYRLGYDYNRDAKCPIITKILERCVPCAEDRMVLLEYLAYILAPQLNYEKVLFVQGTGHNGKSVFVAITTALFGKNNVLTMMLENLTKRPDYRAQLSKGLVNICSETAPKLDPTVFKAMASREPIECRKLYGAPYKLEGTEYASLLLATNTLPKEVEATNAFFRRFLIIPFGENISEEERDYRFNRIDFWEGQPEELSGIMNEVVAALMRLLANDGFTRSKSSEAALEEYRVNSDTVPSFMQDERWEPSAERKVSLKELYSYYTDYCKESGRPAVGNKEFAGRLRLIGYTVERGTGNVNYVHCSKPTGYNRQYTPEVLMPVSYKKVRLD